MKKHFLISAVSLLLVRSLAAQDAQLEQRFKDEFKDKVLLLRDFASNKEIKIKADGTLQQPIDPGIWPLGYMEVAHVETRKKQLLLVGPRVGLRYDEAKKKLVSVRTKDNVTISITGPFNASADEIVQRVRSVLFMPEGSQLSLLPDYWREYYEGNPTLTKLGLPNNSEELPDPASKPPIVDSEEVYRCMGGSFKIPKPVKTPDPEYSNAARALKYQGRNVFTMIIGKSGRITQIFVRRPLGLGLDEQSTNAIRAWTFLPGTKNGEAVNCMVNVDTTFHLY